MTVEEKSNKIATEYLSGHDRFEVTYEEMREAVMDMAEWKDQQLKEHLETMASTYEDEVRQLKSEKDCWDNPVTREAILNKELHIRLIRYKIINELFGETEQDNSDRAE